MKGRLLKSGEWTFAINKNPFFLQENNTTFAILFVSDVIFILVLVMHILQGILNFKKKFLPKER